MHRLLLLVPLLASSAAFAQLAITPPTLPNGYQGTTYASTPGALPDAVNLNFINLGVTGSTNQFQFSVFLGSLPPGMTLSSFGSLRGAPTQQGVYNFTIAAVSSQQERVEQAFSIRVLPPLALTQTAVVGSPFTLPLQCPSFDTVYAYSTQGAVPAGLGVNPSIGWITGVPKGPPGQSTFRWFCNGSGIQARVDVSIDVQPLPTLSFTGQVGATFFATLSSPGEPPYSFYRVVSGELPPGIALDESTGSLAGVPTLEGNYSFVVERLDSLGNPYLLAVEVEILEGLELSITPDTLAETAIQDGPPTVVTARVESEAPSDSFTLRASTTDGAPWLSATPARGTAAAVVRIKLDAAGLAPGRYVGAIDAQSSSIEGPSGRDQLRVEMQVVPAPAELSVFARGIEAAFRLGGRRQQRVLHISNAGSGELRYEATASTSNGGNWLSVSPSSGAASGAAPAAATAMLDPTGLPPGTYKGVIAVRSPDTPEFQSTIPVTMTVSGSSGLLELRPGGLSFHVEQGSQPLPKFFYVQEALGGSIDWGAEPSTTSGGSWLGVTPASGTTGGQPSADVAVSASRLAPGWYFGRVAVGSGQAANSPQSVTVALQVEPRGTPLPPEPSERGLAFISPPMLSPTLSRGIFVGNPTARLQTLRITSTFPGNPIFFAANVDDPRVPAGGRVVLQIRVNASQLVAGVYRGFIDLSFTEGGPVSRVEVLLVVSEGSAGGPLFLTEGGAPPPRQSACTPTSLQAVVVQPGDNFRVERGQPVPIEAFVLDDCGNVPTDAEVTASFTNRDDPIRLTQNRRGGYGGLWTPIRITPRPVAAIGEEGAVRVAQQEPPDEQEDAQITIQANQINVNGTTQIGGSLSAAAGIPVISPGGAVSAASFAANDPLPPGAFLSIFGGNLAPDLAVAEQLPLPTELNTVSVTAAGQPVALQFVSANQINGVLPFGLGADAAQQIVVQLGNAVSTPQSVSVSQAQPAVFTQNFSGSGPGTVVGVRPDGTQFLVSPEARLRPGDVAVIYCAGLGLVDQPVEAADAAPGDPLARTVKTVSVTIGGVDAPVFYSGLAPGFAGLYQINATVQEGTPSGESVPLELTVNDIQNPTVTVAVE